MESKTTIAAVNGWEQDEAPPPLRVADGPPLDSEYGTAEDFLAVTVPLSKLFIPEIGKTFFVRAISGKERDAYEQSLIRGRGQNMVLNQTNARAKLCALALANPDGSRMFTDAQVAELGEKAGLVLERVFDRARKLAGLTNEDMDELTG